MILRKILFILSVVGFVFNTNAATSYHTQRLKLIAEATSLRVPNTLVSNQCLTNLGCYNKRPLKVVTNVFGDIVHIGYQLFNPQIAEAYGPQSIFLSFIERYVLELDLRLDGRQPTEQMELDKVVCFQGDMRMLSIVTPDTPFTVEYLERRMYKILWAIGSETLGLAVPADCQLLQGANAIELEEIFIRDVQRIFPIPQDALITENSQKSISSSEKHQIYSSESYLSDAIRNDLYLQRTAGKMQLVNSPKKPVQSIKNILLTGVFEQDIPLELKIDRYGYNSNNLTITLQQFISYCQQTNFQLYVGIKNHTQTMVSATLFAVNLNLGCNHVLSLEFPTKILTGELQPVKGVLYAFIPLHNVTEKFFTQDIKEQFQ